MATWTSVEEEEIFAQREAAWEEEAAFNNNERELEARVCALEWEEAKFASSARALRAIARVARAYLQGEVPCKAPVAEALARRVLEGRRLATGGYWDVVFLRRKADVDTLLQEAGGAHACAYLWPEGVEWGPHNVGPRPWWAVLTQEEVDKIVDPLLRV